MTTNAPGRSVSRRKQGVVAILTVAMFLTLGVAGVSKLMRPEPAVRFFGEVLYLNSSTWVYIAAAAEITLALWLLSGLRRRWSGLFATGMFTSFLVVHVYALFLLKTPVDCGCLGRIGRDIPQEGWIALNLFGVLAAGTLLMLAGAPRRSVGLEEEGA